MPVRRIATGSGLTESETINFSGRLTAEEQAQHDELMKLQYIDGRLDHIAAHCGAILEPAGLPTQPGNYLFGRDGSWRLSDELRAGDTYTDQVWSIARQRGYALDSQIGYAAQMIDNIERIRRRRASGDHDGALLDAFFLGVKWGSSGIKTAHARKTARMGPRMGNRDTEMARLFLERQSRSRQSPTELKKKIGEQFGLKRTAAIDAIDRGLENLSG